MHVTEITRLIGNAHIYFLNKNEVDIIKKLYQRCLDKVLKLAMIPN
jgi:hypothetical protein